ncbi:MAG TPA: tRNA guanosine(15) transglycosylase TgtA [Thermoplasmata archaeon]|nr:tRNA guanosine(15) transglycosylase TgtA [Thermoplasmata archaeon]
MIGRPAPAGAFELLERDGLGRIGRLTTPHGALSTPALLPVVHPDPERQSCPPSEMARRWGVRAVITSSYITWRTPPLRAAAERDGIHRLLGFDGTVMTDSGAFQQHAYGSVEVGPEEILDFQNRIGSDIATVLDVFTEPEATEQAASEALRLTVERARAAREARSGLLAVPVQGGPYAELRGRSAFEASGLGEILAVGGVVPLLEQYRFPELARVLHAARPALAPGGAVHLFGTGHPMTFAFAALFGVDLFDSSAYHKFARRGKLLFPEGTVDLASVREPTCRCELCAEHPLSEVATWPTGPREAATARHNLLVSLEEVARVRQAIRDGTLWELAERRAVGHPALRAGLGEALAVPETFWPTEPESRRAFRETGPWSLRRPTVERFRRRVAAYRVGLAAARPIPRVALREEYLDGIPTESDHGSLLEWDCVTPFGPVPLELTELYPVGPFLGVEEFAAPARLVRPAELRRHLREIAPELDLQRGWTDRWTPRQVDRLLRWQYGRGAAAALAGRLRAERSRRTGRLRRLHDGGEVAFVLGNDGLPRPTLRGGQLLLEALPPGRGRVVVAEDAAGFVREGRSLFSKFVLDADPALVPGSSALLVDGRDELLAIGRLLLAPGEMGRLARGTAAWVTSHAHRPVAPEDDEEDEPAGPAVP